MIVGVVTSCAPPVVCMTHSLRNATLMCVSAGTSSCAVFFERVYFSVVVPSHMNT